MFSTEPEFAGFWRRVGAYLIDFIVLVILSLLVGLLIGALGGAVMVARHANPASLGTATNLVSNIIGLILGWLYFALMESSGTQGTVGKMLLSMVVTDLYGDRISFGRATGRYFAKILSALPLGFGYVMVAFTGRKQGLHDMIAGTLVSRKVW